MFLHVGEGDIIPTKKIIAILNAESAVTSEQTKEFLKTAKEEGFIKKTCALPKSIIVTDEAKGSEVYMSNISSITLLKRVQKAYDFLTDEDLQF